MMRLSLAFLTGVLMMAGMVYLAGAHFAAPMFVAGVAAVVAPTIALLSSVSRIRAAARFLSAFAHAWEKHIGPDAVAIHSNPLADDIASALVNQGVPKKEAAAAASAAAKGNEDFDPAFRAALKLLPRMVA